MLLFRVENLQTGEGLWYDSNTGENTRLVDALNLSNKDCSRCAEAVWDFLRCDGPLVDFTKQTTTFN